MNKSQTSRWIRISWSEASGAWLLDLILDAKPSNQKNVYLGLTHDALKQLHQEIGRALRAGKKRMAD
jgi:hypothetical protein